MPKIEKKDKQINFSLCLLKIVSMLLIINSHSDALYPSKISFLASGGAIGNELFFLISGYLFSTKEGFRNYCKNRFIRLYVPTYIVTIILLILKEIPDKRSSISLLNVFHMFLWPTEYWFVSSIFVFGIIMYFLSKTRLFHKTIYFTSFLLSITMMNVIIYILFCTNKDIWMVEDFRLPGAIPFKCIYSFIVFAIGYFIKLNEEKIQEAISLKNSIFVGVGTFLLFYIFKVLLNKGIVPMSMQLISQLITITCVIFIFLWIKGDSLLEDKLLIWKHKDILYLTSNITLEAYLVQFTIIAKLVQLKIIFPINFLMSLIAIIFSAICLHIVSNWIIKKFIKK